MTDFAGNVFCINPASWDRGVVDRARSYDLKSSLTDAVTNEEFVRYVEHGEMPSRSGAAFQQAFSYLLPEFLDGGKERVLRALARRGIDLDSPIPSMGRVLGALEKAAADVALPSRLLRQNGGVDPRRIVQLHSALRALPKTPSIIPIHPQRSEFYENLKGMVQMIDRILRGVDNRSYEYFTRLINLWIKERQLGEIVRGEVEHKSQHAEDVTKKDVNKWIRDVIRDVNDEIRFHYVKYVKCYTDVLLYARPELSSRVEVDLSGYIEVGAYRSTTLQLMNAGLSRMTSILIAQRYSSVHSVEDVVVWTRRNASTLRKELPRVCSAELDIVQDVGSS